MSEDHDGSYLALDWGGAKVGFATADASGIVVTPRGSFRRKSRKEPWKLLPEDIVTIRALLDRYGATKFVLGEPKHADGRASPGSEGAKALAEALKKEFQVSVELVPEILTSWASRSEEDEDASAAALILQDYFNERARKKGR